jgi:2-polyprenyl-3-methyl-5-hydroxy-6-metoxy-1,4-benzoquinol methylase
VQPRPPFAGIDERGINVFGIDISTASEDFMKTKGLPFSRLDLQQKGTLPGAPWDLLACCEVAEHLDAKIADVFLDNLTKFIASNCAVFLSIRT